MKRNLNSYNLKDPRVRVTAVQVILRVLPDHDHDCHESAPRRRRAHDPAARRQPDGPDGSTRTNFKSRWRRRRSSAAAASGSRNRPRPRAGPLPRRLRRDSEEHWQPGPQTHRGLLRDGGRRTKRTSIPSAGRAREPERAFDSQAVIFSCPLGRGPRVAPSRPGGARTMRLLRLRT